MARGALKAYCGEDLQKRGPGARGPGFVGGICFGMLKEKRWGNPWHFLESSWKYVCNYDNYVNVNSISE